MTDRLVISAEQATLRGMKLYFTGIPCKHGHVGPRSVSDRHCCECKRQKIRKGFRGPQPRELLGQNIREFDHVSWPDNGRVEVVVDPNWLIDGKPRVVRRVGWRNCMCCKRRMFSPDIAKVRICENCKDVRTDMSDGGREYVPRPRRQRALNQI